MRNLRRFSGEAGFTLAELLAAIALLMMAFIVFANVFGFGLRALEDISKRSEAEREARYVVSEIVWEVRTCEEPTSELPAIEVAEGNEIMFYRVVEENKGPVRIHYFLKGSQLKKGSLEPSESEAGWQYIGEEKQVVVANFVRNNEANPIFRFFDENGVEFVPQSATDRRRISSVAVTIISDVDINKSPSSFKHEAKVSLRNQR